MKKFLIVINMGLSIITMWIMFWGLVAVVQAGMVRGLHIPSFLFMMIGVVGFSYELYWLGKKH